MNDLALLGCRTTPLMSYLKALGVLRHVAREDPGARLWWDPRGHAMLRTSFDEDGLVTFFLERYEPSPITSPWNGGSGYYAKDNRDAIAAIVASDDRRLAEYRVVIAAARAVVGEGAGPEGVADVVTDKDSLLVRWRAVAPDAALEWVDAAMVLTDDGPAMSPLLGTGGNDGRFEFSNNFMQRLVSCIPDAFGADEGLRSVSRDRLTLALLGVGEPRLEGSPVGMFDPGGAGLPNSSSSAREGAIVNAWDFVLMLEGLVLFGGGVGRRLAGIGASFPFTLRSGGVTRVGRSLAVDSDSKTRGETWLPVWPRGAGLAAVGRMMAEGRLQDGREQARSGRTAGRAAASLGVERGIGAFERIVYAERFGRNYVAVPTGHVPVASRPEMMELLRGADRWLASVRRIDAAAIRHCIAAVEVTESRVIARGVGLERWLLALADLQRAVARRPGSREAQGGVRPLGGLSEEIALRIDDGSAEHSIARGLAGVGRAPEAASSASAGQPVPGVRALLEPVQPDSAHGFRWEGDRGMGRGISIDDPVGVLAALAIACADRPMAPGQFGCPLWAVQRFLGRETDDAAIVRLAFALSLCAPARMGRSESPDRYTDRLYALTRLVTGAPRSPSRTDDDAPRPAPQVASALAAGQAATATRAAFRRLTADRRAPLPPFAELRRSAGDARRIAAALAIPLSSDATRTLEHLVLAPSTDSPQPQGADQ